MSQTTIDEEKFRKIFYDFLPPEGESLEIVLNRLIENNQLDGVLDRITSAVKKATGMLTKSQVTKDDLNDVAFTYSTVYAVAIQNLSKREDLDKVISLGERSIKELPKISSDGWSPFGYAVILVADAYKAKGLEERAKQLYELSIKLARPSQDYVTIVKANKALDRKKATREFLFKGINSCNVDKDQVHEMLDLFTEKELQELIEYSEGCVEQKVLKDYLRNKSLRILIAQTYQEVINNIKNQRNPNSRNKVLYTTNPGIALKLVEKGEVDIVITGQRFYSTDIDTKEKLDEMICEALTTDFHNVLLQHYHSPISGPGDGSVLAEKIYEVNPRVLVFRFSVTPELDNLGKICGDIPKVMREDRSHPEITRFIDSEKLGELVRTKNWDLLRKEFPWIRFYLTLEKYHSEAQK